MAQLKAFVTTAIPFVNLEPPLSIATRLRSPAKIIAVPAPTNQSVSVFIWKGNAKLICTTPSRIMIQEAILMRLCTTRFIQLYWGTFYCSIAAKYTTISRLWLQYCFAICTLIEVLAGISRHRFFFLKTAIRANYC